MMLSVNISDFSFLDLTYEPFFVNLTTSANATFFKLCAFVRAANFSIKTSKCQRIIYTFSSLLYKSKFSRDVTRTLIGGGGVFIHIFMFCPTDFF